jgi:hypothetical protein
MGILPTTLNTYNDNRITMLMCMICSYKGTKWVVLNAVFELETSSVYYEFQCPECDSLDIMINLSAEDDEPTTTT